MFPLFRSGVVVPFSLLMLWSNREFLHSKLFPYGIPHRIKNRPSYGQIDFTNDNLRMYHGGVQKIYERQTEDSGDRHLSTPLLSSPETIFFGPDGTMYTATDQGNLISLTDLRQESDHIITAKTTLVKDLGSGRPLGAKFTPDGSTIYIADAVQGLLRLRNPHDKDSKVEIVASTAMDQNGQRTRIVLADDVTIGPKTGKVFFTDGTTVPPPRNLDNKMAYDVLYASKIECLRSHPTGRLLEYDPSADTVTVLATDLWFANGVAVDQNEEYLVVAESFRLSLVKYYLHGEKKGHMEYIVHGDPSPAYFDGVDCAWKGVNAETSFCYAANPSSVVPAAKLLLNLPHPIDWIVRTLLVMFPKEWLPKTEPYGGITIVDPITLEYMELIQDPNGQDISHITGVTFHENKLFLGSLENDFIGVYHLN